MCIYLFSFLFPIFFHLIKPLPERPEMHREGMNCTFPETESERRTYSHACTLHITVLVLRQPQAAFRFPPALQVGWQGCLLVVPNLASVWVSHVYLNGTKSRALLALGAFTETGKERSLQQLCRQTSQDSNFGQRFCDKHSLVTCLIRRFPFGCKWRIIFKMSTEGGLESF